MHFQLEREIGRVHRRTNSQRLHDAPSVCDTGAFLRAKHIQSELVTNDTVFNTALPKMHGERKRFDVCAK